MAQTRLSLCAAAALVCLLLDPVPALSAPQGRKQQRCINAMNRLAANVLKQQNKENRACVRFKARGLTEKLGDPNLAQACLRNDVRGKVGK